MATIVIYGHDKIYRDLCAGRIDADCRFDISLEESIRPLKPTKKQAAMVAKLGRADFSLLIDEDGNLSVTTDRIKRPKVPQLTASQWLARRIPSEPGRVRLAAFVDKLKGIVGDSVVRAQYLHYNYNVSPPCLDIAVSADRLSGIVWDAAIVFLNENRIPHSARYDHSLDRTVDKGGWIEAYWPLEIWDGNEPDSGKTAPFQSRPYVADQSYLDTRKG